MSASTNGPYSMPAWAHGTTTSMSGSIPPNISNAQAYRTQQQQESQSYISPQQQQSIHSQNFHQSLPHGFGQVPHQHRNVELEHHFAPSSSASTNASGSMANMGMPFDGYSLNFDHQQYPSPPLTGPSPPHSLPQTSPPLAQFDPQSLRQQSQHSIPPHHQVNARQLPTSSTIYRHHQAAFNTGTVTGGGPPAAAPPAYVEPTATAIADGHNATSRVSPNGQGAMLGLGSKTPSPKALPGSVGGVNGQNGGFANMGFTFSSPAALPQLTSPAEQQLLGPSVYTPQLHSQQQPSLKRGRYEPEGTGYDEGEEGDMSGELDHDFDYSSHGGEPSYGNHPSGSGDQQSQENDQKRPTGACVRCKNLKVRCEFTTGDPQTCRRCMNGGHECSVPGKKKRKQPPKREHLINEIRSQASEIKDLMEKLETANKRLQMMSSSEAPGSSSRDPNLLSLGVGAETSPLGSPSLATSAVNGGSADSNSNGLHPLALPRPDVQAWIMRARESIEQISGMYSGTAMPPLFEFDEDEDATDGAEVLDDEAVLLSEDSEESFAFVSDREDGSQSGFGAVTVEGPFGDDDDARSSAEHPPPSDIATDDESNALMQPSTRHASPATTVRSVSTRSGSAAPQRKAGATVGSVVSASGMKARTVSMGPGAADPLKLISSLHTGIVRIRGKSPGSRAGSVDKDGEEANASAMTEHAGPGEGGAAGAEGMRDDAGAGEEGGVKVKVEEGEDAYGAAGKEFFKARRGSAIDSNSIAPSRNPVPHILLKGIVTPEEAERLFAIYFDEMNLSCSLLDPVLYTAQATYWRSPFLFTVICTIASRYYSDHPGLYQELTQWAQLAAGTALISGPKTVETVAAYILLSLYPIPMHRWEEDRTWIYLGLAIRVATDINLHHPIKTKPRNAQHARELANRTRVWLNCYNLDRSTASWIGKMSTISNEDYVASHSGTWYSSSEVNLKDFDIHISSYNEGLRVVGDFKKKIHGNPNYPSVNKDLDISRLAAETDEHMQVLEKKWTEIFQKETNVHDPQARFRNSLIKLAYRYGRLIVLSSGFQDALDKGTMDQSATETFFQRCFAAAIHIVKVFVDELSTQKKYLRHGPEAQCVFVTFASAFLIKILHPKYASLLKAHQRAEIRESVEAISKLLDDKEVVVDEKHSPHLWARFLEGLLATPMARLELSPGSLKQGRSLPRRAMRRSTASNRSGQGSSGGSRGVASPPANGFGPTSPQLDMATSPSSGVSSPPPLAAVAEEDPGQGQLHDTFTGYPHQSYTASLNLEQQQRQPQQRSSNPTQSQQQQDSLGLPSSMNIDDTGFSQQPLLNQQQLGQTHAQAAYQFNPNALQMEMPEFFQQPFPFMDNDMLQSMQTMPGSDVFGVANTPGFNWFANVQTADVDTQMGTLDPDMMSMNDGMPF